MADDPNLKLLFRALEDETDAAPIDVSRVIRRSRARRIPRQLGVGAVGLVVVSAVVVGGFYGLGALGTGSSAGSLSSVESQARDDSTSTAPTVSGGAVVTPIDTINQCGQAVADLPPSDTGLAITTRFPSTIDPGKPVSGTVTLTNTGGSELAGSVSTSPAITLAKDGVTVWHTNGVGSRSSEAFDLGPGASVQFPATLMSLVCGTVDDEHPAFRSDLPWAGAGTYTVSAVVDVSIDGSTNRVASPSQTIAVR